MPYKMRKRGNKYEVVNTATGHVKGHAMSKIDAERQMRLLMGVEHGWRPTGAPVRKRVVQPRSRR